MKTIMFTVVFIIEVYLSHQNGRNSGAKGKVLSEHLYLNERLIRTGAHIGFFSILMFLALFLSKWLWAAVVLWAIIDVGWDIVGVIISTVVWMLTQWLEILAS